VINGVFFSETPERRRRHLLWEGPHTTLHFRHVFYELFLLRIFNQSIIYYVH
jgi:hypothetical protein